MSFKVEQLEEKNMVKLVIEASAEEFEAGLNAAYNKNKNKISVPGFRKGKAPRKMIEQLYGSQIFFEDAANEIIPDAYADAAKESGLDIVSQPKVSIEQLEAGKPFIFAAEVAVRPEVELGEYKGVEVTKADAEVTDADVEEELKKVQDQNSRTVSVEDRAVKDGDMTVIDFEGFIDGEAFEGGKGENYPLTIGSHSFIDTFEEQMIGMNIGEEREISVKFPEEYHADNLAGKDAKFKVKLISIKAKDLPAIDDEFVKDISEFETLDEYKKDLKEKLAKKKEDEAKASKESQVIEKIIENTEVEIPEAMVNDEVTKMIEEFSANLTYQGLNFDTYCTYANTTKEEFSENLKPQAIKDIKLKLALEYIANKEEVKVEDTEINEKIEELAKQYGSENADSLKENANVRKYMNDKLQQDKTLEVVVNSAIEE